MREDDTWWWVCAVCGGPRVPLTKGEALTDRARRSLRASNDERVRAAMLSYASFATFFGALTALVVGAALVPASLVAAIAPLALAPILAVIAFSLRGRSKRAADRSEDAWHRAWDREIEHLLAASKGSLTAPQIARAMKVPEEAVEEIAARLSASDRVRVDVDTNAQLRISKGIDDVALEEEHDAHARELDK